MSTGVTIRLIVPAAKAKPSPAIGQSLGAVGVNMMKFCKEFNARTTQYKDEVPMRVKLTAMPDSSFTFSVRLPSTSWFLKKAAGIDTGSGKTKHLNVGKVHVKQLYEIAKVKQLDSPVLQHSSLEGICRMMMGQMRSMGLELDDRTDDQFERNKSKIVDEIASSKAAYQQAYIVSKAIRTQGDPFANLKASEPEKKAPEKKKK